MSEILDNKLLFQVFMKENGFEKHIPVLYVSKTKGQIIFHDQLWYPCVCKPVLGRGAEGVYIAQGKEDIKHENRDEIIEQYIPGETEYSAHFSVKDGKIAYSVYFMAKYSVMEIKRGDIRNYEAQHRDDSPFNRIFEALNYTGFACANFKILDDTVKIFEINPRLGGSILGNKKYLFELKQA